LYDLANLEGAMQFGTSDLDEIFAGWSTLFGDHPSMYNPLCDVTKRWARLLIAYGARLQVDSDLKEQLLEVSTSDASPDLVPREKLGGVRETTDAKIGPNDLRSFFLHYIVRLGLRPLTVAYLAYVANEGRYSIGEIKQWLGEGLPEYGGALKRFFGQRFKGIIASPGPKIGSISLNPRGDFRMSSDTLPDLWLADAAEIPDALD